MRIPQFDANDENAPTIKVREGLLIRTVSREKGIESPWVSCIVDGHMFNVSLTNSKAADAARDAAMNVSTNPSEIGADVEIKLTSVHYGGEKIGELKAYDGSDVNWAADMLGDLILVRKLSRTGDLVLTKGDTSGNTGLQYPSHGDRFVHNFVESMLRPDQQAAQTVFLKFLDTLYQDGIDVDYDTMSFTPKGDARVQKIEMELIDRYEAVAGQPTPNESQEEGEEEEGEPTGEEEADDAGDEDIDDLLM